jgi:hypothetical protein
VPPSDVKGGPENLSPPGGGTTRGKTKQIARGCQLILWSAISAGNIGSNRSSERNFLLTLAWFRRAGHVILVPKRGERVAHRCTRNLNHTGKRTIELQD